MHILYDSYINTDKYNDYRILLTTQNVDDKMELNFIYRLLFFILREENMSQIVQFPLDNIKEYRKKCKFINRNVKLKNEEGETWSYPCIGLYEIDTNIPIWYTGYERYVISLVSSENLDGKTLAKRAIAVCHFLNYLLHETDVGSIHECSINTIREYLKYSREKKSGETYNRDTWIRYRDFLFTFLKNYYIANKDVVPFAYNGEDLQQLTIIKDRSNHKKAVMVRNSALNVKAPVTKHKKNRILVEGYLELLLLEAKKHDPEIVLAIGLQAYAGIREGEVVNMTCGALKIIRRQFAMIASVELELSKTAPFFGNWEKETEPGSIKKKRVQKVYDDFLDKIIDMYETHILMMESKKYDTSSDAPLFLNYYGRPMTVQTYSKRVKNLFYKYFLPALKLTCEKQNTWADNAAFIETYEKEYPGAHMFRHWFTMYLITRANLSSGEVMKWRGDSSQESMNTYIHENSELIEIYRTSSYAFQSQILDDIR